ncbi:UDP-N-acetylmuramate dehydrogenase [Lutispora thermophila]|uniref:UDP-N-acetylenolpyruvoylglucosamine reductase n=1 Tax=Lutispora thermophila DSM 19022 TaxID=1122184 RepID=A0A1M6I8X8_9FIRM|nr:UDP-N-acetylmuramate dehydrogenase [Lutispora thermophila]SHJ30885.1 UDP-N-acetylmuramate dehydrogenase [Lutispora thermophila DSM 19022]
MHLSDLFSNIKLNEPMKNHTSFKVGGNADIFIEPENVRELTEFIRYAKDNNIPYYIIGNGTNLLVSDYGISGAVIKLGEKISSIQVVEDRIIAQCGAKLPEVAKVAMANSLSGLEFASGIPGSIGGAVAMNAGAYGHEMKDVIETVEVLDGNLEYKVVQNKEMEFGYRKSAVWKNNYIVLGSTFKLKKGSKSEIVSLMDNYTKERQSKQPLDMPSAGSVFKRPEGYYTGKLIEDAGLRGMSIGGAQVSEKHCGFIVNKGGATARDIYNLIKHIQKTIYERFGVELETEVKLIGKFE